MESVLGHGLENFQGFWPFLSKNSATKPESEAVIQSAIGRLAAGKTLIGIAHRLATIQNSDNIYVFQNGVVAERGTHEQLLAVNGLYQQMWDANLSVRDFLERGPVYA